MVGSGSHALLDLFIVTQARELLGMFRDNDASALALTSAAAITTTDPIRM